MLRVACLRESPLLNERRRSRGRFLREKSLFLCVFLLTGIRSVSFQYQSKQVEQLQCIILHGILVFPFCVAACGDVVHILRK